MLENKMAEVAKLLGLELEEEFKICENERYKFTVNGSMLWSDCYQTWVHYDITEQLLLGRIEIIKLPKPILDAKEKEYLSAVIKPFRKHIITIRKIQNYRYEFIEIVIYRTDGEASCEVISFPYFNKGKMYKGMKINKEYALDELGL